MQEDLFVGSTMKPAENSERQTCNLGLTLTESNARWAALGAAHTRSSMYAANVLNLLLPAAFCA